MQTNKVRVCCESSWIPPPQGMLKWNVEVFANDKSRSCIKRSRRKNHLYPFLVLDVLD
jgi:hypothetical protein